MSRLVGALFILVSAGWSASALGAGGDNAILINVSHVELARKLPGLCQVNGRVETVLQGKAFHRGDGISLHVPCGIHTSAMPLLPATEEHNAQLVDPQVLLAAKFAGAHVDDAGNLLWKPTARAFGTIGAIWGYRVLDGSMLPAQPATFRE
jgi:hypothetical protein